MDQWVYEGDLELDLLATPGRRGGQGRDLVQGARELRHSLNQCRALQRPLSRVAPQARGFFDEGGLGVCVSHASAL